MSAILKKRRPSQRSNYPTPENWKYAEMRDLGRGRTLRLCWLQGEMNENWSFVWEAGGKFREKGT